MKSKTIEQEGICLPYLAYRTIEKCADMITGLFKPGAMVTILVRNPTVYKADVIITKDDWLSIIDSIKRLETVESEGAAAPDSSTGKE